MIIVLMMSPRKQHHQLKINLRGICVPGMSSWCNKKHLLKKPSKKKLKIKKKIPSQVEKPFNLNVETVISPFPSPSKQRDFVRPVRIVLFLINSVVLLFPNTKYLKILEGENNKTMFIGRGNR
jgi:hypothetical protein